jgi:uncharacterized phiE125 gp8 family phage protein
MLKVTSAPAEEPVSLAEAKAHLKVDYSADDDYITALITAARQQAEEYTNLALIDTTYEQAFDGFPATTRLNPYQSLVLWRSPLISVTSVVYTAEDGTSITEDAANYKVDTYRRPPSVSPVYGYSWQSAQDIPASVVVTFRAGYADADSVPVAIKQALLLMIGSWYDNREDSVYNLPTQSRVMLDHYRVSRF